MSNSERYVPATELALVLPTRLNGRSHVSRRMSYIVQFVSWIAQSCWRLTRTLSEKARHVDVHDVMHWDVGSVNRQFLIGGRREGVPEANMRCVQCIKTSVFVLSSSSLPCEPRPHLYYHSLRPLSRCRPCYLQPQWSLSSTPPPSSPWVSRFAPVSVLGVGTSTSSDPDGH